MYVASSRKRVEHELILVQIYSEDDLGKAKLEVLSKTNMVDVAMSVHKKLYKVDTVPPGLCISSASIHQHSDLYNHTQRIMKQSIPSMKSFTIITSLIHLHSLLPTIHINYKNKRWKHDVRLFWQDWSNSRMSAVLSSS